MGGGSQVGLVLGAGQVVLVGVLAEVVFAAGLAGLLEQCLVCFGSRLGSGLQNLFGEDFCSDGWEGSDSAFEVVTASGGKLEKLLGTERFQSQITYCQSLFIWPFCKSILR